MLPPAKEPAAVTTVSDISIDGPRVLVTPAFVPVAFLPTAIERIEVAELVESAQQSSFDTLSPYELRKRCQESGIKWRNARGKNKHMTKPEMVKRLAAIS